MDGTDPGRHALEANPMMLAVAGQMLAQMDHFVGQGRQKRNRQAVVGLADSDKGYALLHPEIR